MSRELDARDSEPQLEGTAHPCAQPEGNSVRLYAQRGGDLDEGEEEFEAQIEANAALIAEQERTISELQEHVEKLSASMLM